MRPRSSSSSGCFNVLITIGGLFFIYAFLRLATKTPPRAYMVLELWAAIATFAIPLIFVLSLVIGRTRLNTSLPDPDPTNPFADLAWSDLPRSEQFFAVLLGLMVVAAVGGIGWQSFTQIVATVTPLQLQWWASAASGGVCLAALVGYRLGVTPMEDRRRFALATILALLVLFSIPYVLYLWNKRNTLPTSFWAGLPFGIIGIGLTWRYCAAGWQPTTLSWTPTRLDRHLNAIPLFVVGIIWGGGLIALNIIFGNRSWMLSSLIPWLLFLFSYMLIQGWRYRPKGEW